MLELEYRSGTVVLRFQSAVFDAGAAEALVAALAYIGPRPVVLTGTGNWFAPEREPAGLPAALAALRRHQAPVIAAIAGDATGAGYALAAAADLRIIADGLVHPSGRPGPLTASAAVAAGLADLCCPPARLLGLAVRLAARARPGAAA